MEDHDLNIQELNWEQVKDSIYHANPDLAEKLNRFPKKFSFLKASYLYGDKIYENGDVQIPTKSGDTISLSSDLVPEKIKEQLNYCYLPLGMILTKSVEVFFETKERVMPSKLFKTGTTFGLWEIFDPEPSEFLRKIWNLSAGARTTFMLSKVGDSVAHSRLKKDYGITGYAPKRLLDQYEVFKEISHREKKKEKWRCEILFFSGGWLKEEENNIHQLDLKQYWLHEAWQQSYNCRNQMSYDVAWESFSREVTRRNWKPRPYIINTIKHLMSIAEGIFPGFCPTESLENAVPDHLLQKAYMESYMLKDYAPIIMQPHHLRETNKSVYYSLYLPTLLEYAPHAENPRSIMADMRELKMLTEMLSSEMDSSATYEFYHCEKDQFGEIENSTLISERDPNFSIYPKKYGKLKFPENSPFFRGCIKVTKK